ncbi:MAG: PilZ domain-containing protein [Candidatus Omnitrophica bacterium]|nr:PilZ domain-containing protein [Candidatus Omnitrophota bacterium]
MKENNLKNNERRRYIRLDSVFPVQIRLLSANGKTILSDWQQAFTHNVSDGGMRIDIHNCSPELFNLLQEGTVKLQLKILLPLSAAFVNAQAKISWFSESQKELKSVSLGVVYEYIEPSGQKRIMRYARIKQITVPVLIGFIAILAVAFGLNSYMNYRLVQGNKALVAQLISILQEWSLAKEKIKDISRQKEELQLKIDSLQARIEAVTAERESLREKVTAVKQLTASLEQLQREKAALQEQLLKIQQKESKVTEEFLQLGKKRSQIERANFEKMYKWLVVHQNPRTGLVMSFEGDEDLSRWAFSYDQSLALQAYTLLGDIDRARLILEFYRRRAKKVKGFFVNAYYVDDGSPVEYIMHSGPNIWLGIGIAQFIRKTKDKTYLYLAEEIAEEIIKLQQQDEAEGIRGGPEVSWYSTEHNLDAYAFFNMLFQLTDKEIYHTQAEKVLLWLVAHTYDKKDIPIKRGKGDATIATDTYAWSIAAIGPEKLIELGMNPDLIMEFAEQNCAVNCQFQRPDGTTVAVKGFDFASPRNVARGGVISTEWTAQMIISFKIMAEYYRSKGLEKKASFYEEKADEYLVNLCTMIIVSPSPSGQGEGCLPYASQDVVDTGHGWLTPKGKSTGSVAATAYTLFAYYNYNPLKLAE